MVVESFYAAGVQLKVRTNVKQRRAVASELI